MLIVVVDDRRGPGVRTSVALVTIQELLFDVPAVATFVTFHSGQTRCYPAQVLGYGYGIQDERVHLLTTITRVYDRKSTNMHSIPNTVYMSLSCGYE